VKDIVALYLPTLSFFGFIVLIITSIVVMFVLVERRKREKELMRSFTEFSVAVESLILKFTPLLDAQLAAVERTKECPQCKKQIDEAYGACPFCSHQFSKKYFVYVIGPGDERALDAAAKKLSAALKIDFHQMKHRLRMGFDYAISDHAKRHEFMTAVEKMDCTVKEIIRWV